MKTRDPKRTYKKRQIRLARKPTGSDKGENTTVTGRSSSGVEAEKRARSELLSTGRRDP
jgi:hypothetical protein